MICDLAKMRWFVNIEPHEGISEAFKIIENI